MLDEAPVLFRRVRQPELEVDVGQRGKMQAMRHEEPCHALAEVD